MAGFVYLSLVQGSYMSKGLIHPSWKHHRERIYVCSHATLRGIWLQFDISFKSQTYWKVSSSRTASLNHHSRAILWQEQLVQTVSWRYQKQARNMLSFWEIYYSHKITYFPKYFQKDSLLSFSKYLRKGAHLHEDINELFGQVISFKFFSQIYLKTNIIWLLWMSYYITLIWINIFNICL